VREAEQRFAALRLGNIVTRFGDGTKGWPEQAPFDRIIVTAAAPQVPQFLLDQLALGGVLVMPVGADYHDQRLVRVRHSESGFATEELTWVRFVPLVAGLPRPGGQTERNTDERQDVLMDGGIAVR
jgi:protein-L-isoaspartate(D-aspartate) O-methyltransferase